MLSRLILTLVLLPNLTLPAAPPDLAALQQQYEKAVLAPHQEAKSALDAKFATALENAIAQAKQAGRLDDVLALQQDQKRLAEDLPFPEDDDTTLETLKRLRAIYREQLAKLEAQRQAGQTALLPAFTARLKELEATLTKADRIEEALEVKTYRESLATSVTAAPVVTGTPAPPAAVAPPPAGKGDDRAAAELILSLGGKVRLTGGKDSIVSADKLPKGKFTLQGISYTSLGQRQLDEKDAATLSHLEQLESFQVSRTVKNDESLSFLATCPALKRVDVQNGLSGLSGAWLGYLAPLKKLETLFVISAATQGVSSLASHAGDKLVELSLRDSPTDDSTMAFITRFSNLRLLGLRKTRVTDEGMRHLSVLKDLQNIDLTETTVGLEGVRHLAGIKLMSLGFGLSPDHLTSALPELARLFSQVVRVNYPTGGTGLIPVSAAHLSALGRAWPKLERIAFPSFSRFEPDAFTLAAPLLNNVESLYLWDCPLLADANIAGIAEMKKVARLDAGGCEQLTDASIPHLQSMRSLKQLSITRTRITPAAAEALRKERPDMRVDH